MAACQTPSKLMVIVFGIICLLICLAVAKRHDEDISDDDDDETIQREFQQFKNRHGKKYKSQQHHGQANGHFKRNREFIRNHNKGSKGQKFKLGLNKFADMDHEEVAQMLNGANILPDESEINRLPGAPEPHPKLGHGNHIGKHDNGKGHGKGKGKGRGRRQIADSVNFTDLGYTTDVVNQGGCGCCWAISAAEAIQAQWGVVNGALPTMAPQQLLDCAGPYGNHGCSGGWPGNAMKYAKDNGINDGYTYPFAGQQQTCSANPGENIDRTCITGVNYLPAGDENALAEGLYNQGPMSVCINANSPEFIYYSSGVYTDYSCSKDVTHAVLLTGYGTDYDGTPFWLVQNSWGTDWGEEGYIRFARNNNNQCGIASWAHYPVMEEC